MRYRMSTDGHACLTYDISDLEHALDTYAHAKAKATDVNTESWARDLWAVCKDVAMQDAKRIAEYVRPEFPKARR